jgi:hypothetical protein
LAEHCRGPSPLAPWRAQTPARSGQQLGTGVSSRPTSDRACSAWRSIHKPVASPVPTECRPIHFPHCVSPASAVLVGPPRPRADSPFPPGRNSPSRWKRLLADPIAGSARPPTPCGLLPASLPCLFPRTGSPSRLSPPAHPGCLRGRPPERIRATVRPRTLQLHHQAQQLHRHKNIAAVKKPLIDHPGWA